MNGDLIRIVDSIHRDRDIDKEIIFEGIEMALISAVKRRAEDPETVVITIDRETGAIEATADGRKIDPEELGRIAALTAKQVIMQKIREAERDVVYQDFEKKQDQLVTGIVQRVEGPNVIVNLGKTEGLVPPREQIDGESYHPGDRLKFYIVDVKKSGQKVRILLSRTHPDLIKTLFEMEVPEISEGIIEIKGIAREAGQRSKIAVLSNDARVDCVGACVGVRGARIKSIVSELNGEKIDIVEWSPDQQTYISNALKPAEGAGIRLAEETHSATVTLPQDQLSLAIGKRGQNVRLASRLTGWDIDIVSGESEEEYEEYGGEAFEEMGEQMVDKAGGLSEDEQESEEEEAEKFGVSMAEADEASLAQTSEDGSVSGAPSKPDTEEGGGFGPLRDLISNDISERLHKAGLYDLTDLKEAGPELLEEIEGVDTDLAQAIYDRAAAELERRS
jgi:N utilization substance protein A